MRETGATDEGHACEVVVAGGDGKAAAARRRRRLELRRLGLAAKDDAAAKRIRSVKDGSSSDDSSTEVVPRSWPACVSHGSVSVIGRRREMEDAVAIERTFMASTGDGAGAIRGGGEGEEDFFAVYDGHGGSRVAEACRKRMHVVLAEEVSLRRLRGQSASGGDVRWKEAMLASFARMDGEVVGSVAAAAPRRRHRAVGVQDGGLHRRGRRRGTPPHRRCQLRRLARRALPRRRRAATLH